MIVYLLYITSLLAPDLACPANLLRSPFLALAFPSSSRATPFATLHQRHPVVLPLPPPSSTVPRFCGTVRHVTLLGDSTRFTRKFQYLVLYSRSFQGASSRPQLFHLRLQFALFVDAFGMVGRCGCRTGTLCDNSGTAAPLIPP